MTATQAPTPGPLTSESVKLLVKGDLLMSPNRQHVLRFCRVYEPYDYHDKAGVWLSGDSGKETLIRDTHYGDFAFIGRPDESGWMPWSGGENPVPGQRVERKERSGDLVWCACLSDDLRWSHSGWDTDIIAFRLASTTPVEASGSERVVPVCHEIPLSNHMKVTLEYDPDGSRTAMLWNEANEPIADGTAPDLAALRPQPSGETRECIKDALTQSKGWPHDLHPGPAADAILALLSARPLALGGQHGVSGFPPDDLLACVEGQPEEPAGCAEPQVGRSVYERIEKLLKTDPTGWERAYLCHLVESVEEVGGYDGPRLDDFPYRKAVSAFLKLRDESVGPGEADDEERLESAGIILSLTTPARAEAQDEGVAGEAILERLREIHRRHPSEYDEVCDIIDFIRRAHPSPPPAGEG